MDGFDSIQLSPLAPNPLNVDLVKDGQSAAHAAQRRPLRTKEGQHLSALSALI